MDINALVNSLKNLVSVASSQKDAVQPAIDALKDVSKTIESLLGAAATDPTAQQVTLSQWQDLNETMLALGDLDTALAAKGPDVAAILQDVLAVVTTVMKVAVILGPVVAPLLAKKPASLKLKARKLKHGWQPDLPDHRDKKYSVPKHIKAVQLPPSVDLRSGLPAPYDQGRLGSCTANAIAGAIQFDQAKQKLPVVMPSRLFIYYCERAMEGTKSSDSGAQIRDGVKVINDKGACDEATWPYVEEQFAVCPPKLAFAHAYHHKAVSYHSVAQNLADMKGCLAEGYPIVFGFTVFDGFESEEVATTGVLNMPGPTEQVQGGHAVLICGYDDATQRFLVRNSWSENWGLGGYFTMPYAYATNPDLADDFWTVRVMK